MFLKIIYSDDSFIQIELFDTPAIQKWFDFFRSKNTYRLTVEKLRYDFDSAKDQTAIKQLSSWHTIKNSLKNLKSLGYKIPKEFENIENQQIDQSFCNQLHRFFTYNELWYYEQNLSNPYDSDFQLPENISITDWHEIIDPINLSVHQIEKFVPATENKRFVKEHYPLETFYFENNSTNILNQWLEFNEKEQKDNFNFFLTPDKPIVFLAANILGKSVLQSFLDEDDPSARDCTGRKGSYGSFCIDFTNIRKELYTSNKFSEWISYHNLDPAKVPFEFPIGYVQYATHTYERFESRMILFKEVLFLKN